VARCSHARSIRQRPTIAPHGTTWLTGRPNAKPGWPDPIERGNQPPAIPMFAGCSAARPFRTPPAGDVEDVLPGPAAPVGRGRLPGEGPDVRADPEEPARDDVIRGQRVERSQRPGTPAAPPCEGARAGVVSHWKERGRRIAWDRRMKSPSTRRPGTKWSDPLGPPRAARGGDCEALNDPAISALNLSTRRPPFMGPIDGGTASTRRTRSSWPTAIARETIVQPAQWHVPKGEPARDRRSVLRETRAADRPESRTRGSFWAGREAVTAAQRTISSPP
jgi:hypothetical protein